jgi:Tfp pilus assembly protein PilE
METSPTAPSRSKFLRFGKSLFTWRAARRVLVGFAILATLLAIFYAEENWRGKRAWEKCKRELEAKGMDFNWEALVPPPVPDEQNIFKVPKMAEWFAKLDWQPPSTNELSQRLANSRTSSVGASTNAIQTAADAREYLAWSDQFSPEFDLMREALRRPYARIDGNYTQPMALPVPNFVMMRSVDQTLAQRAHCHLLLGEPDKALRELTLIHDLCRILKGAPTGKPMTLVAAMINVAVTGLYANTVADGLRMNAWREPQLIVLEQQLGEINLTPMLATSFRCEQISSTRTLETTPRAELVKLFDGFDQAYRNSHKAAYRLIKYAPQGWLYQNLVAHAHLGRPFLDAFDVANQTVSPRHLDESARAIQDAVGRDFRHNFLTSLAMPNFVKAIQTFARNQTSANEAAVACALERYRLVHGGYPETLSALAPHFIAKLPHDTMGQPFKYRRTNDEKFLLYSVGWNETDDDGKATFDQNGFIENTSPDWVWPLRRP